MKNQYSIAGYYLAALLLVLPVHDVIADDEHHDYIKARQLLRDGKILPLEIILVKARKSFPGRVLEVELEVKSGNDIVYEVEILRHDGIIQDIYINATTGELLFTNESR